MSTESSKECPGCTCSEGGQCDVYLEYSNKHHWFTTESKANPGYVICEFCDIEALGEVEL